MTGVLAEQTNMAALGAGVLLLGGWIVGGILMFRSAARRRAASEDTVPAAEGE